MNIDRLLNSYFKDSSSLPTIEVFDNENVYNVYVDIVKTLKNAPEVELSVLQLLSYCFYEILDNVLIHSEKNNGTVLLHYDAKKARIKVLIADDGIGIHQSLSENAEYQHLSEPEALRMCVKDRVTDGKGMGFGLYSTVSLIRNAGVVLEIHSGQHILRTNGIHEEVLEAPKWQGTIIYLELHSDKEIDPNSILEHRTDAESEFNETFIDTSDIDELW